MQLTTTKPSELVPLRPIDTLLAQFTNGDIDPVSLVRQAALLPDATEKETGRPTTLTASKAALIISNMVDAIKTCKVRDDATLADYAGISVKTMQSWISRGMDVDAMPLMQAFSAAHTRLRAELIAGKLDDIDKTADAKVKWAVLEGAYPSRFNKQRVVKGNTFNVGNQTTIVTPQVAFNVLQGMYESAPDDGVIDVLDD